MPIEQRYTLDLEKEEMGMSASVENSMCRVAVQMVVMAAEVVILFLK